MERLKEAYKEYFRIGVACEKINGRFTNHEIGNPDKERCMLDHFNSMTFGNELKPAYNMGWQSPEAKEDFLPFVINPVAYDMLSFCRDNGMPVRGHVMVWHSQCANEAFCKGYKPVTIPTDPEILKERPMMKMFEKLDPVCFVDRETMKARLRSYIFSLMEYMYANDFMRTIYAWDVVNEAIELADKTPTGLRNSYWYQVIGDDFIYWAFRYAHDAVQEVSRKYASQYGVDPSDEVALRSIQPRLFYNDYNEFFTDKKAAIIAALTRETDEHGSIIGEGLIDGIGMQAHLSDNTDLDLYEQALYDYGKLVGEIHLTELDVKCTCTDANREYYQAVFYKDLFERLIKARKSGVNITCVTFWGLTDDNSWIRGADPLLFHKDLSTKKSYDGVLYALTGESLGEPLVIVRDLSNRHFDFEGDAEPESYGFKMRGFGRLTIDKSTCHSGTACIALPQRFGDYCNISFDASDFVGQTIKLSAYVKSPAPAMMLQADFGGEDPIVATVETKADEWTLLEGVYSVPRDVHSIFFYFSTKEEKEGVSSPTYVDDVKIELIGLKESFEGATHIAQIRGTGHLPVLIVTDEASVDGKSKSLKIMRQEREATMKFPISVYAGRKVEISAYVKTRDKVATMGLELADKCILCEKEMNGDFVLLKGETVVPEGLKTVDVFIETDGNAEYYVDEIFVKPL